MPHYSLRAYLHLWHFAELFFFCNISDVLFSAISHIELSFVYSGTHLQLKLFFAASAGHPDPCDGEGVRRSEIQESVHHQPITRGIPDHHLHHRNQGWAGGLAWCPPPAPLWSEWVYFCVSIQRKAVYVHKNDGLHTVQSRTMYVS